MKAIAHVYINSIILIFTLSCFKHNNPFDMHGDNYDPPRVFITTTSLSGSDSTTADSICIAVSGNRSEVEVRYRIDSLLWSDWGEQRTVKIGVCGEGCHVVNVQGRYGEGGDTADTSLRFVKTAKPSISTGISCNGKYDERFYLLYDSMYTLSIQALGTPPLVYIWYNDTVIIDTTVICSLVINELTPAETGTYTCKVFNKWGDTTSAAVLLLGVPLPVTLADMFNAVEDSLLTVDSLLGVLANDSIEGRGTFAAELADNPQHGVITLHEKGGFVYLPTGNYNGLDTFYYHAVNVASNASKKTTVIIRIAPLNDAPVALHDSFVVKEDTILLLDSAHGVIANDYDVDSRIVGAKLCTETVNGNLLFTEKGNFTYLPEKNYSGVDSFSYVIKDNDGASSDTVWAHITIEPANDPPFIINYQKRATLAENGMQTITRQTGPCQTHYYRQWVYFR